MLQKLQALQRLHCYIAATPLLRINAVGRALVRSLINVKLAFRAVGHATSSSSVYPFIYPFVYSHTSYLVLSIYLALCEYCGGSHVSPSLRKDDADKDA
jgi:hypothetical protein